MAVQEDEITQIRAIRRELALELMLREGIQAVGIGRSTAGRLCIRVSGTATALADVPAKVSGIVVEHRVAGGPTVAAIGRALN